MLRESVFPGFIRAMWDDARRGDDRGRTTVTGVRPEMPDPPVCLRKRGDEAAGTHSGKPPVLRRGTIQLIAVLGLAATLYGTLLPFGIDFRRRLSWQLTVGPPVPGDAAANVLIYAPIGAFLRLLFRRRGSSRWVECGLTLALAAGVSYLSEVIQSLMPARIPSWTDTLCNVAGATIGLVLAPLFQRGCRNLHAWLYHAVRTAPLSAIATAALICLGVHALSPLDIHPSPQHLARALHTLRIPTDIKVPAAGVLVYEGLSASQMVSKTAAAGAYGLLAFLIVLAAREARRSVRRAVWTGLSRSVALAAVIELLQLFTVSHVADWRDLMWAWIFCGSGALAAGGLAVYDRTIHGRPAVVLRGVLAVVMLVLLVWSVGAATLAQHHPLHRPASWLPMVSSFDRSWDGLLGDYTAGLMQYALAAGLLVLWCRSHHQFPRTFAVMAAALLGAAVLHFVPAILRGYPPDTAHLLLAMAAGVMIARMDRAIWSADGCADCGT